MNAQHLRLKKTDEVELTNSESLEGLQNELGKAQPYLPTVLKHIRSLLNAGLKQHEICTKVNKSQSYISTLASLLYAPNEVSTLWLSNTCQDVTALSLFIRLYRLSEERFRMAVSDTKNMPGIALREHLRQELASLRSKGKSRIVRNPVTLRLDPPAQFVRLHHLLVDDLTALKAIAQELTYLDRSGYGSDAISSALHISKARITSFLPFTNLPDTLENFHKDRTINNLKAMALLQRAWIIDSEASEKVVRDLKNESQTVSYKALRERLDLLVFSKVPKKKTVRIKSSSVPKFKIRQSKPEGRFERLYTLFTEQPFELKAIALELQKLTRDGSSIEQISTALHKPEKRLLEYLQFVDVPNELGDLYRDRTINSLSSMRLTFRAWQLDRKATMRAVADLAQHKPSLSFETLHKRLHPMAFPARAMKSSKVRTVGQSEPNKQNDFATLTERLAALLLSMRESYGVRGFWSNLATKTGIPRKAWVNNCSNARYLRAEDVEAVLRIWPEYASWIMTGKATMPEQIIPDSFKESPKRKDLMKFLDVAQSLEDT